MFQRILVAIDKTSARHCVVDKAIALAQSLKARLLILHVLSPLSEGAAQTLSLGVDSVYPGVHSEAIHHSIADWQHLEQEGMAALQSFQSAANNLGILTEINQQFGEPGRMICEVATDWNADLIVVGRRGLSGLSELLLGSVSNYVLHRAPCSVLTVQPIQDAHLGDPNPLHVQTQPLEDCDQIRVGKPQT
jgi:nucleotide-binding universal stress UspA family protein